MKKIVLSICLLISCIYGQDINTDSISVQSVLNSTKKELRTEAANNPKFKWEIIPICDLPIDIYREWNLPSLVSQGSKIICFDGYGGVIWLKENACYIIIKTTYDYRLQWWQKDDKDKWTIYSTLNAKIPSN